MGRGMDSRGTLVRSDPIDLCTYEDAWVESRRISRLLSDLELQYSSGSNGSRVADGNLWASGRSGPQRHSGSA